MSVLGISLKVPLISAFLMFKMVAARLLKSLSFIIVKWSIVFSSFISNNFWLKYLLIVVIVTLSLKSCNK